MNRLLKRIIPPGINPYKLVELYAKYCPVVPEDYWEDELYVKPADKVLKKFKEEKVIQKDNQAKVKAMKEGEDVNKGGRDGMKEEIKKMNVAQLKEALQSYGLTVNRLKADLRAQLNTHLLELEVVGDDGEGKADTMKVDTIPVQGGGEDKAPRLS
jgi:hypothetical protein